MNTVIPIFQKDFPNILDYQDPPAKAGGNSLKKLTFTLKLKGLALSQDKKIMFADLLKKC